MSWSGLTSKQTITFDNLQDAVNNDIFIQIQPIPVSPNSLGKKEITVAEAESHVLIDPIAAAKPDERLVIKTDLNPQSGTAENSLSVARYWQDLGVSKTTGQYMVALETQYAGSGNQNKGYYWISANYGGGFRISSALGKKFWTRGGVSPSGKYMWGATNQNFPTGNPNEVPGSLFVSSDYGANWSILVPRNTQFGLDMIQGVKCMAFSADGQYQTVTVNNYYYAPQGEFYSIINRSIDYGVTWTTILSFRSSLPPPFIAVSMSSDGMYQYAACYDGLVYKSSDYGATWTNISATVNTGVYLRDISVSPDGKFVTVTKEYGIIRISENYGVTFTTLGGEWTDSVATNLNGFSWGTKAGTNRLNAISVSGTAVNGPSPNTQLSNVDSSANASRILMSTGTTIYIPGYLYVSGTSGSTWGNPLGLPWGNVTPIVTFSTVTITPQNGLDTSSYTFYVNGAADPNFKQGSMSLVEGTTIKIVYASPACSVSLGINPYVSNTSFDIVGNTTYAFTLGNANNWVDGTTGSCTECVSYKDQINDCGDTRSVVGGAFCNTNPTWTLQANYTTCASCVNTDVYKDTNPCSSTQGYYRIGTTGAAQLSAPTNAACVTTANWVNSTTGCYGVDLYNVQIDNNPCSPTSGTTRQGTLITANSYDCGYLDPVTFDITSTCTGTTQTVTISNYSGGNNTYTASTVTYGSASLAASGATTTVTTARSYLSQPANSDNYTRYVIVKSGYRSLIKQVGTCCNGTPNWVSTGTTYYTCSDGSVNSYPVTKDENPCSGTYNKFKANNVVYTTSPANSYPSTAETWVNSEAYSCYGTCNKYHVEVNNNPCSPTYNTTRQGGLVSTNTTECYIAGINCCGQSTTQVVGGIVGYYWQCDGSSVYSMDVRGNNNVCYPGADIYYFNGAWQSTNPSNDINDVAESYSIRRCDNLELLTTISYCKGTMLYNQRVLLSDGTICYVVNILPATSAGTYAVTIVPGVGGCPTTYTIFSGQCDGQIYYIIGNYPAGNYITDDTYIVPSGCLFWESVVVSESGDAPAGTQFYNITQGLCPGCN